MLVELALNPFLHGTSKTQKPGFGGPDPSLAAAALLPKDFKKTRITLTKKLQRFAYHR